MARDSQDLRERVIDAGTSGRQAAERFGTAVRTIGALWIRLARSSTCSRQPNAPIKSRIKLKPL
jgi:hypothetical protein